MRNMLIHIRNYQNFWNEQKEKNSAPNIQPRHIICCVTGETFFTIFLFDQENNKQKYSNPSWWWNEVVQFHYEFFYAQDRMDPLVNSIQHRHKHIHKYTIHTITFGSRIGECWMVNEQLVHICASLVCSCRTQNEICSALWTQWHSIRISTLRKCNKREEYQTIDRLSS